MKRHVILIVVALAAIAFAACSKTATNTNNANTSSNTSTTNTTNTSNTNTTTSTSLTTPTSPTDILLAAFDAAKKKDVAGFKKHLSPVDLEELGKILEKSGKSADDFLKEMVSSPDNTMPDTLETRNEKIDGEKASVEYKGKDGEWKTAHFAKEGGGWKWKLGNPESKDSGSMKGSDGMNNDNQGMEHK
jgi:hypothetical protein